MKLKLTDKDLRVLSLFISIPQIPEILADISPSRRTIYRRLEKYGWVKPERIRKSFEKENIMDFPDDMSDFECKLTYRKAMADLLEETISDIKARLDRQEKFFQ